MYMPYAYVSMYVRIYMLYTFIYVYVRVIYSICNIFVMVCVTHIYMYMPYVYVCEYIVLILYNPIILTERNSIVGRPIQAPQMSSVLLVGAYSIALLSLVLLSVDSAIF